MLRLFALLALLLLLPPAAEAQREFSHDDPQGKELNYFKRPQADAVRLLTADGAGVAVRRVLIRLGNRVLGVETSAGVDWRNEDRVRLRGVPIVGQLFFDRFRQADLAPRNRIGTVYRAGDALYVDIDRDQPHHPITEVVILNQDKAYFLAGTPQPTRVSSDEYAVHAGQAFIKDGTTLLLLIEPSVIQHNLLDRLF
jgi:alkylated DNA repair dioxygenase AlkB